MSRVMAVVLGATILLGLAGAARTHEGHDHGPEPEIKVDASPRGHASSAQFEVVAIAQGDELVIYLDRFATNEPVPTRRSKSKRPMARHPRPEPTASTG
jgi:cobalt-zinc-cadmium efflux system membrane fusion protein